MLTLGFLTGLALVALGVLRKSFVKVDEGERAALTRFGRLLRDGKGKPLLLSPGLHPKAPWDHVHRVPVREQSIDLGGVEHRWAMTHDGIEVRYDAAVRYRPRPDQVEHYLFALERPAQHMTGTFTCLLRNTVATFGPGARPLPETVRPQLPPERLIEESLGAYAAIRRERETLESRLASDCHTQIGERFGVTLEAVDVLHFEPPESLRAALHGVIQAKADTEAALFRAQGESQQRLLAAREGVEIARQRAEAVGTEMRVMGGHLRQLHNAGVLNAYVSRRTAEVLSESRHVYVRGGGSAPVDGQGAA